MYNFIIHAFRTKNLIKKNDEYRTRNTEYFRQKLHKRR